MSPNHVSSEHRHPVLLPVDFREPALDNPRYRPDGAMPADPYNEKVKLRQQRMNEEFGKLFERPPGIPKAFSRMVEDDHIIFQHKRTMLNFEGYHAWRDTGESIPDALQPAVEAFALGEATEGEILDIGLETSIGAFEIGKLTFPYGRRQEYHASFTTKVDEAILARGGTIFGKALPYRSIDIRPSVRMKKGEVQIAGFMVPYKRDVGEIPLSNSMGIIRIVERLLVAVRADAESGFNQQIIQAMTHHDIDWGMLNQNEAFEEALRITGCRGFIERAIQLGSEEPFIESVSSTIYGFKELYRSKQRGSALASEAIRLTHSTDASRGSTAKSVQQPALVIRRSKR